MHQVVRGIKVAIVLLAGLLCLAQVVRVRSKGEWDGLFLVRRDDGFGLLIKDDIYYEERDRVVAHVALEPLWRLYRKTVSSLSGRSYLDHEWNEALGRGFIRNYFPDGTRMIVTFGRARDDHNRFNHGLFVGGGLPITEMAVSEVTMNETGMAFYTGKEWHHLWCTANEGLRSGVHPDDVLEPAEWEFLASRVIERNRDRIVIWSGHAAVLEGVPLHMDRFLSYRAGDRYFVLAVSLQNVGSKDLPYYYIYGDEPWVGDYGSSAGDVGWVNDRLIYFETILNPVRYGYAGMYDIGNPVIGEGHNFTGMANFVEWLGKERPDLVYFSNDDTRLPDPTSPVPLSSVDNRILVMQWGPRTLRPGQRTTMVMAFGMAQTAPGLRVPAKPAVAFDPGMVDVWLRSTGR